MMTAQDPRRSWESPLLHFVAESNPCPAGTEVLTLCGQGFAVRSVTDSALDQDTIDHLCMQCRHLAKLSAPKGAA